MVVVDLPNSQTTDNAGSSDGGVTDGDDILEFGLEDTVVGVSLGFL